MPLNDYLDDLEGAGPRLPGPCAMPARAEASGRSGPATASLNLHALIDPAHPVFASIPSGEVTVLLERLKTYAKRVHRLSKQTENGDVARSNARRENSMPVEIAQVLYDLAGALALTRCKSRVVGLTDDRYRKNVFWLLSQPWLDSSLRPVFFAALEQLDGARKS